MLVKFLPVNVDTGVSIGIEGRRTIGQKIPEAVKNFIPHWECDTGYITWYVGEAHDSTIVNPSNHLFELSPTEYVEEAREQFNKCVETFVQRVYEKERQLRQKATEWYHHSELSAGVRKYEYAIVAEPLDEPDARNVSATLTAEADARGITVKALAAKVIEYHTNFLLLDATIAGIRGKKCDEVRSIVFDEGNPKAAIDEIKSTISTPVYDGEGNLIDTIVRPKYDIESGWPNIQ